MDLIQFMDKNLIGTFYQKKVLIEISVLNTL